MRICLVGAAIAAALALSGCLPFAFQYSVETVTHPQVHVPVAEKIGPPP